MLLLLSCYYANQFLMTCIIVDNFPLSEAYLSQLGNYFAFHNEVDEMVTYRKNNALSNVNKAAVLIKCCFDP